MFMPAWWVFSAVIVLFAESIMLFVLTFKYRSIRAQLTFREICDV